MTARRVFHLADDLGPRAAAKQLATLAPELAAAGVTARVGVLGDADPFGDRLAAAGVDVVRLPVRYAVDIAGVMAVVKAVRDFRPDVVHAWGPLAVRVAALTRHPRVVSSHSRAAEGMLGFVNRAAARRTTPVELPPVVPAAPPPAAGFRESLGLAAATTLILAAGGFEPSSGMRTAVWAFDILKYTLADMRLVLLGDGPGRGTVERFARSLGADDMRITFAGRQPDLPAVLGHATVVWVPPDRGGANVALEAMAAGVPVVATANPDLAGIVTDRQTGRLVPLGDRIRLAAVTLELLNDPLERTRIGEAARGEVRTRFAPGPVVDRLRRLYDGDTPAGG